MNSIHHFVRNKMRFVKNLRFNFMKNHTFITLQYDSFKISRIYTFTYDEFKNKKRINKRLRAQQILLIIYQFLVFCLLIESTINESDFFVIFGKGALLLKSIMLFAFFASISFCIYITYDENNSRNYYS